MSLRFRSFRAIPSDAFLQLWGLNYSCDALIQLSNLQADSSSPRLILVPREHLAMSGDIFDHHNLEGVTDI